MLLFSLPVCQVLVNEQPRDILFKRVSAYVPQEEVFVPTMSALETIAIHAELSLPSSVSGLERRQRIESVLSIMGLSRVKHTTVRPPAHACMLPMPSNLSCRLVFGSRLHLPGPP